MTTDQTAARLGGLLAKDDDRCEHGVRYPHQCDDCDDDAMKPENLVKRCLEYSDEVAGLKAERTATQAEIARLRGALGDVVDPIEHLRRYAESRGSKLNGNAYSIGNNLAFVQQIARDALQTLPPKGDGHE